jgi:hypothetical protein
VYRRGSRVSVHEIESNTAVLHAAPAVANFCECSNAPAGAELRPCCLPLASRVRLHSPHHEAQTGWQVLPKNDSAHDGRLPISLAVCAVLAGLLPDRNFISALMVAFNVLSGCFMRAGLCWRLRVKEEASVGNRASRDITAFSLPAVFGSFFFYMYVYNIYSSALYAGGCSTR